MENVSIEGRRALGCHAWGVLDRKMRRERKVVPDFGFSFSSDWKDVVEDGRSDVVTTGWSFDLGVSIFARGMGSIESIDH
jgi:hypothetical protein